MNVLRILQAVEVATSAHHGQVRKFTDEPYINHPVRVAQAVIKRQLLLPATANVEDVVIAALFHDTLEDTKLPEDKIKTEFGENVLRLVKEVTSIPQDMAKFAGKTEYLIDKMNRMSKDALFLKLMDRDDNVASCARAVHLADDPDFRAFAKKTGAATLLILAATEIPDEYQRFVEHLETSCRLLCC